MIAVQLSPEKIFEEVTSFNRKLATGLKNLQNVKGLPSGVTPKEEVYKEDKLTLYHYKQPNGKKSKNKTPLLISYALVNRPYMTDIQENRSTVKGLMESGQDVYLIDWGYPDRSDRFLTMDDHINGYLDRCVDVVRELSGSNKVNLLGICQGGTFSLCYTALHPEKIKNLITMVTPVDFQTDDNMLYHWAKKIDVDQMVDSLGNISGTLMNWTFLNMKPQRMMVQKYIDMVDIIQDPKKVDNFMNMEKWIFDSPDQAGETYRQFIIDFYQNNKLIKGEVKLGDATVNLKDIKVPVLNVFAHDDHLVPPSASKPLKKYVGTKDYTEISFGGGHIGIYVSGSAQKTVTPAIGKWLNKR